MSRGRDAELLGNLDAAAPGTVGQVAGAADQGLEGVVARLAMIFIEWHAWNDSSVSGTEFGVETQYARASAIDSAQDICGILEGDPGVVNAGRIGLTGGGIAG